MSGFTPGPWHAWMEGKTICVLGKERDHKKPVVTWMGFDGCNRTLEKQGANARLIAAAPELYEALERCLAARRAQADWPENDSTKRFDAMLFEIEIAEDAAKAALAKARGDQ